MKIVFTVHGAMQQEEISARCTFGCTLECTMHELELKDRGSYLVLEEDVLQYVRLLTS